jgi:hypothetical protein
MLQALRQALLDLEARERQLRDWVVSDELPPGLTISPWRPAVDSPSVEELAAEFMDDDTSDSESDAWWEDDPASEPADDGSGADPLDGDAPDPLADPLDGYESTDDFRTSGLNPRPLNDESSDEEEVPDPDSWAPAALGSRALRDRHGPSAALPPHVASQSAKHTRAHTQHPVQLHACLYRYLVRTETEAFIARAAKQSVPVSCAFF